MSEDEVKAKIIKVELELFQYQGLVSRLKIERRHLLRTLETMQEETAVVVSFYKDSE